MKNESKTDTREAQDTMNSHFRRMLGGILDHAERDVLLARAASDTVALAKAQARLSSLQTAQEIYAAAHKLTYGIHPQQQGK